VPVIFMTAMDDTAHKVEGFNLGAVDYITKPIQREELLARIRLHLQLHRLQRELEAKSEDLALKNTDLEAYGRTIAHSLKTPLAAAIRFLEILHKFKADNLSDEQRTLVRQALNALVSTGQAVDALLLLSTLARQHVEPEPLDMAGLVRQAMNQLADLQAQSGAEVRLPETWAPALGYGPWVGEIWLNLLSNAFKYSGSPPRVELGASREGGHVRCWVRDNGTTLTPEEGQRVFEPFTRLQQERAPGHGLGLATARRIVAKLGGEVAVRPAPAGGNEFSFTLPAAEPDARKPGRPRAPAAR
jgi:signal transduction histidine kinase